MGFSVIRFEPVKVVELYLLQSRKLQPIIDLKNKLKPKSK